MRYVSEGEHSSEMAIVLSYLGTAYEAVRGVALRERERADIAERELRNLREASKAAILRERDRAGRAEQELKTLRDAISAGQGGATPRDPGAYDPAEFPPSMTIPEAADRVGLARDTLRTRVEKSELIPVEVRKNLRYYATPELLPLMGPSTAGGNHGHNRAPHR